MKTLFPVADPTHIVIFALITALCLLGDSMLYVVLPIRYGEAGLASLWEVGIVLAANRLVRLPLNPCIAWFYTRFSERTGILIATILACATTLSYALLPGLAFWIVARCAWGIAWTLLRLGSLFCILNLSTPLNRGEYTGLFTGMHRLGSLVGMLVGGILADSIGFTATATLFGTISALAICAAFLWIPKSAPSQHNPGSEGGVLVSLNLAARDSKALWMVAAGCFIAFATQGVITSCGTTDSNAVDNACGGIRHRSGLAGRRPNAFSVDLGAAIGPLMAYSLIEFIGIDAVYLITAALFIVFLIRWSTWEKTAS